MPSILVLFGSLPFLYGEFVAPGRAGEGDHHEVELHRPALGELQGGPLLGAPLAVFFLGIRGRKGRRGLSLTGALEPCL